MGIGIQNHYNVKYIARFLKAAGRKWGEMYLMKSNMKKVLNTSL